MLTRQPLWVPVMKHNPAFYEAYKYLTRIDVMTSLSATAMQLNPQDIHVALVPDARHPSRQVAAMMAFPVRVSTAACDNVHNHALHAKPVLHREMTSGFATTVCDSYNSFHVMERLLPNTNAHVSVNIQSQCVRLLKEGERAVVVSSIDKMGKRLVYCKTEFFVEPPADVATTWLAREQKIQSFDELRAALTYYEKVFFGTHVKSIMSEMKA